MLQLRFRQPVLYSDLMSATEAPGAQLRARRQKIKIKKKIEKAPLKLRAAALRTKSAALAKGHFEGMYQTVRG